MQAKEQLAKLQAAAAAAAAADVVAADARPETKSWMSTSEIMGGACMSICISCIPFLPAS
jgi:hypothetical protein